MSVSRWCVNSSATSWCAMSDLPREIKMPPSYDVDRTFLTKDGSVYEKYVRSEDKFIATDELWDVIPQDEMRTRLAAVRLEPLDKENEDMLYDPKAISFVFIKRRSKS